MRPGWLSPEECRWTRRLAWGVCGLALVLAILGAVADASLALPYGWYGTRRYDGLIRLAAKRHLPANWDWQLLKALVRQESQFDPEARSDAGAVGLAQVLPATGRELGYSVEELREPAANLDAASRYLGWLHRQWRHVPDLGRDRLRTRLVLASYNAGVDTVWQAWLASGRTRSWEPVRDRLPAETREYVARILGEHLPLYEAAGRHQLLGFRSYLAYRRTQPAR